VSEINFRITAKQRQPIIASQISPADLAVKTRRDAFSAPSLRLSSRLPSLFSFHCLLNKLYKYPFASGSSHFVTQHDYFNIREYYCDLFLFCTVQIHDNPLITREMIQARCYIERIYIKFYNCVQSERPS